MANQDSRQSPQIPKQKSAHKSDCIFFSPRFKSAAAMAGWDEEALRLAFEDTPSKPLGSKKRSDSQSFTSPPTNSSRKRRTQKRNSLAAVILDLDEIEGDADSENKKEEEEPCSNSSVPCIDRLREELSCAICLDICYEPSTTTCGHSFCKKCLQSAAEKCGKRCPKCRQQFISNGRSCSLNTVLWNTIQLLFPQEVEDRKKAIVEHDHEQHQAPPATARRHNRRNRLVEALNSPEEEQQQRTRWILRRTTSQDENTNLTLILDHDHEQNQTERRHNNSNSNRNGGGYNRNRIVEALNSPEDEQQRRRRRTMMRTPTQNEDAAMALRLQRQEYMEASRQEQQQRRRNPSTYLRAIASRAVSIRHLRRNNNNRQS